MDKSSLSHCCYVCTYHIVFIPKYRRRIMYGGVKKDIVEILKKLIEMKDVLWGYYVATVGNVNEETILEYLRNQEESDKLEDGIK